jgi:hypothetical protein
MTKKVKIIASIIMALLILTVGSAATVMAQSDDTDAVCRADNVLDEGQLEYYVNLALEEGTITPEEAAAILTWWAERPEAAGTVLSAAVTGNGTENRYMYTIKNMAKQGLAAAEGEMVRSRLMVKAQECEEAEDCSQIQVQKQAYKVNKVSAAVKVQARNKLSAAASQ